MMSSPSLVSDLECVIFLLAYDNDPRDGKRIALVAKRVFDWIIPRVYDIVILTRETQIPISFNQVTYRKYGHHTHHLRIDHIDFQDVISLFPNVTNLAFWDVYTPEYLPSILKLPLQHLSAGRWMTSPQLFQQLFVNITHLHYIPEIQLDNEDFKKVLYLPRLTHVRVPCSISRESLGLFLERERCPALRVVAIWHFGMGGVELSTEKPDYEVDDQRVVRIECSAVQDWAIGARGGMNMWRFAEMIVAERRVGCVEVC